MDTGNLSMKDLPASERPRERIIAFGPGSLSNAELLAVIIRTGEEGRTALDLAWHLLKVAREAAGPGRELMWLADATCEEFRLVRGIGCAKAAEIKAAIELGKRAATSAAQHRPEIRCPSDIGELFIGRMRHLDREHFHAVLLNTKNQVLGTELVSVGSLNEAIVHPREIFRSAVKKSAAAVILVHNHPSGDPSPSPEDVSVTRRMVEAGRILGIEVLDHIVVGEDRFVSLRETGVGWPAF